MESWQAMQNWFLFILLAGGLAWYYMPESKKIAKQAPTTIKETKEKVKKTVRKPETKTVAPSIGADSSDVAAQDASKKRKAGTQMTTASFEADANEGEIDMSTRQFAMNMTQARQGISMKTDNSSKQKVKTVKAGTSLLPSDSFQADGDEEWSHVASPPPKSGGIDDMLEPAAPGPNTLRITAPQNPMKERAPKQAKKVAEVETKKQRQNRKKVEERKAAREAEEAEQKKLQEQQRRIAREARGEPAKNGTASSAPLNNPWAEKNAARDAQLPVHTSDGGNAQLLDTFETESNSSSNQEVISTAATSTTDAPSRWADDVPTSEDDYAKAIRESERETGWSEVKSNKKLKKKSSQVDTNGASTPVVDKTNTQSRFGALTDEGMGSDWAA